MTAIGRSGRLAAAALFLLGAGACGAAELPTNPGIGSAEVAAAQAPDQEPTLLAGNPPGTKLEVSAVFGARGGVLKLADHKLAVPKGAVDRPTRFTMRLGTDGYVAVELAAMQQDADGDYTVDVGSVGFREPVTLKLSYAWADGDVDASALSVVWLVDGTVSGHRVRQESWLDIGGQRVKAKLYHFSSYALAAS